MKLFDAMVGLAGVLACMLLGFIAGHAHAAEPVDVPQLVIVVGYQDGKALGGQILGIADNLEGCQKGLEQALPMLTTKPGVTLAGVCTPLPPAPSHEAHKGEASV